MSTRRKGDRDRVVITGVGLVTPLGSTWSGFCDRLLQNESAIEEIDLFDTKWAPNRAGGQVRDFDWGDVPRDLARELSSLRTRSINFAARALFAAREDAKVTGFCAPHRVGISLGTGLISFDLAECRTLYGVLKDGGARPDVAQELASELRRRSLHAERHAPGWAVRRIADRLDARGPTRVHASTCAASAIAIAEGLNRLRRREIDVCYAGGFDSQLHPFGVGMFAQLGALSLSDRPPAQQLRPFDRDRDGMVIGEGAAIVTLERKVDAEARGARIRAVLLGAGASMDAWDLTAPHPAGRGAVSAMRRALRDAGVGPERVDYVNAHGTGTLLNDPIETLAVKRLFGPRATRVPISSCKPAFGHLIGASGAIEALATLAAIERRCLPPTLNLEHADEECDLDYVPLVARPARVDVALSNSFGFGGYNAAIVLGSSP
jgi:3-oxoacyl-[acyl-carrier-protein] synthase II